MSNRFVCDGSCAGNELGDCSHVICSQCGGDFTHAPMACDCEDPNYDPRDAKIRELESEIKRLKNGFDGQAFLSKMGLRLEDPREGDEIEVTVRVVSRLVTKREEV